MQDTFLGLTKTRFGMVVILILCLNIVLMASAATITSRVVEQNHKTVNYLCSTTTVLDGLTVAAIQQIQQNFDNGTYYKLEQQGILSKANIAAARVALVKYQAAHVLLHANGACRK